MAVRPRPDADVTASGTRGSNGGVARVRRAAAVALAVAGVCTAGTAASLAAADGGGDFAFFAAMAMFTIAGGFIAHRRPSNPVGWLLAAWGLTSLLSQLGAQYGLRTGMHGHEVAGWLGSWMWALGPLLLGLSLLRFPDGDLPGRNWRWPERGGVLGIAVILTIGALLWPYRGLTLTGVTLASGFVGPGLALWDAGWWLVYLTPAAGAASMVVRYRRSGPIGRTQIKWIVLPALLAGSGIVGFALTGAPGHDAHPIAELLALSGFFGIPISITVAVLRYRLYEIDRLISRTLSYALITGVLLAVYAGAVVAFGRVLTPVTRVSDVAVAASTLLVAALFQPVRRRVQSVVDRRFNRARYDAQRTVHDFAGRLRDAMDLTELRGELVQAVDSTVAPSFATIWIREGRA